MIPTGLNLARGKNGNGKRAEDVATNVMHIDQVSKAQLARALNEQTVRFETLKHQLAVVTKILIAAILEPEGFAYADGRRTCDTHALSLVKPGMQVAVTEGDDGRLVLSVHVPPVVETPPLVTGID